MSLLELSFSSGEDSLSVRRFVAHEALSSPFTVDVWARSPHDDVDHESFVGKPASLRVVSGMRFARAAIRVWTGVCSSFELVQAEPSGLSTYLLQIVPTLWLLGHRTNFRIFQHETTPDIVGRILKEWGIEPAWKMDRATYPTHEYRVQYGESDLAFLSRLLEEAGITYAFPDDGGKGTKLTLLDAPEAADARAGGPIEYADNPSEAAEREFVTHVRLTHDVRPGRATIRDFDFRRKPEFPLLAESPKAPAPEDFYEQYRYQPGAFLIEPGQGGGTPVADDRGVARHEEKEGKALAERSLAALRAPKRRVAFETNVLDLLPGTVFSLLGHARSDLAPDKKLLVTAFVFEGSPSSAWHMSGTAHFADVRHRPPLRTEKPRVLGVQSAIVVGPKGEEIHTDEFGRVRVQFHWDREGKHDERSSCWIRVSHAWAGTGFGTIMIPRIGHEVVVGFFDGDPDQPLVVGRVYNNTARVPYKLPDNKTVSTWKSDSSPHTGGFNEIKLDDKKGEELVYIQAQKDLQKLVKHDETERTGHDRSIRVGQNRSAAIGAVDSTLAGQKHAVTIVKGKDSPPAVAPTGSEMIDKRIEYTTGEAKVVFEGANILLEANGTITIHAIGGDVIIKGGPYVKVNCS